METIPDKPIAKLWTHKLRRFRIALFVALAATSVGFVNPEHGILFPAMAICLALKAVHVALVPTSYVISYKDRLEFLHHGKPSLIIKQDAIRHLNLQRLVEYDIDNGDGDERIRVSRIEIDFKPAAFFRPDDLLTHDIDFHEDGSVKHLVFEFEPADGDIYWHGNQFVKPLD